MPPGKGPFPAVVYLHGSGGDRTELLVPATWMAARGVVALTITMPEDAAATTGTATERLVAQRQGVVDSVIAARRAVDALASLPQVDRSRIGLVGWSSGARIGAILAGVDRRVEAFDLLSGGSPPVQEYASQAPANLRPAIIRELGTVDPLRWVAHARPGTVLLQDGRKDEVVPRAALRGAGEGGRCCRRGAVVRPGSRAVEGGVRGPARLDGVEARGHRPAREGRRRRAVALGSVRASLRATA